MLYSLVCRALDYNLLSGTIPPSLGNLTRLQTLCAHRLRLFGMHRKSCMLTCRPVRTGVCRGLSNNDLTGVIPISLLRLTALQAMCVHRFATLSLRRRHCSVLKRAPTTAAPLFVAQWS